MSAKNFIGFAASSNRVAIGRGILAVMAIAGFAGLDAPPLAQSQSFVRGDANADGVVDVSDPVFILRRLFQEPAPIACEPSADSNDDGQVDISDPIRLLLFLFVGGSPLPGPFPGCGTDPTPDGLRCLSHPPCATPGVPQERLARLTRGINVSRPFWGYQWTYDRFDAQFARRTLGSDDIETIRSLGFRHVRLAIADRDIFDPARPARLDPWMLSVLVERVEAAIAGGLAVILDWHAGDGFLLALQSNDEFVEKAALAWGALAGAFASTDPGFVFFEVLNEPVFEDGLGGYDFQRWDQVLSRLHGAIRAAAPEHTVIVGGANWNDIEGLRGMKVLGDPNVVYNFHFYEPFVFTHQGADWGGEPWSLFHDVPYPSSPDTVAPLLDEFPVGSEARGLLEWYGEIEADSGWLEEPISRASAWASARGVALTCNEFGAYEPFCPRAGLLAWHRDMVGILEKYGIGWCKWEYDEGFGIATHPDGDAQPPVIDMELVSALGLAAPAAR